MVLVFQRQTYKGPFSPVGAFREIFVTTAATEIVANSSTEIGNKPKSEFSSISLFVVRTISSTRFTKIEYSIFTCNVKRVRQLQSRSADEEVRCRRDLAAELIAYSAADGLLPVDLEVMDGLENDIQRSDKGKVRCWVLQHIATGLLDLKFSQ